MAEYKELTECPACRGEVKLTQASSIGQYMIRCKECNYIVKVFFKDELPEYAFEIKQAKREAEIIHSLKCWIWYSVFILGCIIVSKFFVAVI
jgi:hypothetical protein